jgi:membrane-bound metal-dependent hydrolase YbcI (DUF457 family)
MANHHTHVAVGLLAGVAVASVLHLDPLAAGLFAISSAGAALLPDIDTPTSAVSHAGGWILAGPLWVARKATRIEHRGITHTLLAGLLLSLGVFGMGQLFATAHGWVPAYWPDRLVVPALLAMLAVRSILTFGSGEYVRPLLSRQHRWYLDLLVAVGVGYLGYHLGTTPHFALGLAFAVGAGFLSHLVVDAVMNGAPLLWPLRPSLHSRVVLGHINTGGLFDRLLGVACLALAIFLFLRGVPQATPLLRHIHA